MFMLKAHRQGVATAKAGANAERMPKHEQPVFGNAIVAKQRGCNPDEDAPDS